MQAPDLGLDLVHALDPVAFAVDQLGFEPDDWQADLMRSQRRRIAAASCRQGGKTHTTAAKAIHRMMFWPGSLILCVGPVQRQAQLWFEAAVGFIRRLEGAAELLDQDNALSCKMRNGSKLVALPAEPSRIRGFAAPSIIVVDEAAFIPVGDCERLFNALTPMLATNDGQLILISSANGQLGYFFKAFHDGGEDWQRFLVTADMCPRIPAAFLESERRSKLEWQFQQEYYCRFASPENAFLDFNTIRSAFDPAVTPLWSDAELLHIAAGAR